MAIIAHIAVDGTTTEQYDALRAKVGWLDEIPDGGIVHMTWWEDGTCHNADAWESEDALNRFAEQRLGPGMAAVGITSDVKITVFPAHEVFAPAAVTICAT